MGHPLLHFSSSIRLAEHWLLMQVDRHCCAHARHKRLTGVAIKRDDYRDALADLGKVAAGIVLRRQQRELSGRRIDDLVHMTREARAAIGIYLDVYGLPGRDIVQRSLVNIGSNGYIT